MMSGSDTIGHFLLIVLRKWTNGKSRHVKWEHNLNKCLRKISYYENRNWNIAFNLYNWNISRKSQVFQLKRYYKPLGHCRVLFYIVILIKIFAMYCYVSKLVQRYEKINRVSQFSHTANIKMATALIFFSIRKISKYSLCIRKFFIW